MEKEPSAPAVKSYCVKSCSLAAATLVAGVCSLLPSSSLKKTARCHPYNHRAGVCIYSEMPVRPQKRHFAIQNVLPSVCPTLNVGLGSRTQNTQFRFQTALICMYFLDILTKLPADNSLPALQCLTVLISLFNCAF